MKIKEIEKRINGGKPFFKEELSEIKNAFKNNLIEHEEYGFIEVGEIYFCYRNKAEREEIEVTLCELSMIM